MFMFIFLPIVFLGLSLTITIAAISCIKNHRDGVLKKFYDVSCALALIISHPVLYNCLPAVDVS